MSTMKFTTLTALDGSKSVEQETIFSGTAKTWGRANQSSGIVLEADFNVSSATDVAAGNYSTALSSAFSGSDEYSTTVSGVEVNNNTTVVIGNYDDTTSTASAIYVWTITNTTGAGDATYSSFNAFGDLA
jgi:hypothetical protein